MVITYAVFESADAALARLREISSVDQLAPPTDQRLDVGVPWPHVCYFAGQSHCDVVVGPVFIDILSRVDLLGLDDDPHLRDLVGLALDQLHDAQPTGLGL